MNKEKIQYKNTEKFTTEVIDEVLEVKRNYGLTADSLLKKASKKSSSLYEFFDWDNSSAGEKWRLHQARGIINEIKIIIGDKEQFAFEIIKLNIVDSTNVKSNNKASSREYKSIVEIMNNDDYRRQLIKKALAEAKYWKERHYELQELKSIFIAISEEDKKWQQKQ